MRGPRPGRRVGAATFDFLCTLLGVQGFLPDLGLVSQAGLALLITTLWVSLVEAQDGMTPGQQIFSLKRLQADGQRLQWRWWPRCLRAAWQLPGSRTSLFWVPK
jgi:hypothetical protein